MEGLKWLVITLLIALVHMPHVLVMENAANVFHITAEAEKYRDASSPYRVKRLIIAQLKISTKIIS